MHLLLDIKQRLDDGRILCRDLIEASLSAIEAPGGEGPRAFLSVFANEARLEADRVDAARRAGGAMPPFAGIPIAVKDLFDTRGAVTRAGSRVLDGQAPAVSDADAVAALRRAGFIIVGKNHMTEFAYSGLGLNAHFSVPLNPFDRQTGRIPGGSSSGGAVAVADGMVPAALGSDTGGSCRIPAAFCGIVGFKPTARRVSTRGSVPLSETLDAVGTLARSVSCCAVLDDVLCSGSGVAEAPFPSDGLRLGVVEGHVDERLDESVAAAYSAALTRLSRQGVRLMPVRVPELAQLPQINRLGGFVGAEAFAWHRPFLASRADRYDPWILARFEAGRAQSAADYIDLLHARQHMMAAVHARSRSYDALVLPTVQIAPPALSALADPALAQAMNLLCLRNTSIANFLDRPAISLPCHEPGSAPVGLMLVGETLQDRRLLAIAQGLEAILAST
ncbi:MAG: amidase [Burkholderiaceae bacterium]